MQSEVIFAGFGGQGVLAIGQILAMAGMEAGHPVVWLPSYGPEMRGGTANCTVVIADEPVASPIISSPTCVVVMNRPSFDKFSVMVKPEGHLIVNSSLIDVRTSREDIHEFVVPANDLAIQAGSARGANMVMLGALIGRSKILPIETVQQAIETKLGGKKEILTANLSAFQNGYKLAVHEALSSNR